MRRKPGTVCKAADGHRRSIASSRDSRRRVAAQSKSPGMEDRPAIKSGRASPNKRASSEAGYFVRSFSRMCGTSGKFFRNVSIAAGSLSRAAKHRNPARCSPSEKPPQPQNRSMKHKLSPPARARRVHARMSLHSSLRGTPSAFAKRTMISSVGLRTPRSIPLM